MGRERGSVWEDNSDKILKCFLTIGHYSTFIELVSRHPLDIRMNTFYSHHDMITQIRCKNCCWFYVIFSCWNVKGLGNEVVSLVIKRRTVCQLHLYWLMVHINLISTTRQKPYLPLPCHITSTIYLPHSARCIPQLFMLSGAVTGSHVYKVDHYLKLLVQIWIGRQDLCFWQIISWGERFHCCGQPVYFNYKVVL